MIACFQRFMTLGFTTKGVFWLHASISGYFLFMDPILFLSRANQIACSQSQPPLHSFGSYHSGLNSRRVGVLESL